MTHKHLLLKWMLLIFFTSLFGSKVPINVIYNLQDICRSRYFRSTHGRDFCLPDCKRGSKAKRKATLSHDSFRKRIGLSYLDQKGFRSSPMKITTLIISVLVFYPLYSTGTYLDHYLRD